MRIAAIGGPTASGKTKLAAALRGRGLPLEVINFDALQVYRGLNAATAKPSEAERAAIPFHLIDVLDPSEAMTAGRWASLATPVIAEVIQRGALPLLVGGTGLYLRALTRGLAPIPPIPPELRGRLESQWQTLGAEALHAQLAEVDPTYAAGTPAANRQRVLRALEVYLGTGKSFSAWHREHAAAKPTVTCHLTVLAPPAEALYGRIDARAVQMAPDLLTEVDSLIRAGLDPRAPAMQALGYRDAAEVLAGRVDAAGLPARLCLAHRAYAKRQITWFAAERADLTVDPDQPDTLDHMEAALRSWFLGDLGN